jgi:hypothetical protein
MQINWEDFDNNIKNIKHPHVLIHKFFSSLESFDDKHSSIILRYIIKNNLTIFIKNPFFVCIKNISVERFPETIDILSTFYELIKQKIMLLNKIKIWYSAYKNKSFWNKEINKQIEDLYLMKNLIKANFDCSKGGVPFNFKMVGIIKNSDIDSVSRLATIESAAERLKNVFKIMGREYFKKINLPIFSSTQFFELESEEIIKYTNIVYLKTLEIITATIEFFENYNMICLKLDNLLNPFFVNIEEDTVLDDDIEDMSYLMS